MLKRKEIESEVKRETAYSRISDRNYGVQTNVDRTRVFHEAMGLLVRTEPAIPSVSERILRAKLLLEEVFETIEKGLGLAIVVHSRKLQASEMRDFVRVPGDSFDVEHIEGVKYDPIETLDGLADVKVIANGTAVQFGLPMEAADYEVWASNMTKLDENGKPIMNRCVADECIGQGIHPREPNACHDQMHALDTHKPIGKILKPDTYVPANITRIFVEFAGDENATLNRAWLLAHGEHE